MTDTSTLERPLSATASTLVPEPASAPVSMPAYGDAQPGEYLSFRLGDEDYGVAILDVKEIRSFEQPTRIADAPNAVLGVVNLRGTIVPIVDLRRVFDCAHADIGPLTVVIVLGLRDRTVGVVVDAVSDVVEVAQAQLRPPPPIGMTRGSSARSITGLACLSVRGADAAAGRMVVLLRAEALAEVVRQH